MAGWGPGLGQPADTRLVLTSDTGLAIQLYSMLKYEMWAAPVSLVGTQGSGGCPRPGQDLDHLASKTKSLFCVRQSFLFSGLELKTQNKKPKRKSFEAEMCRS